MLFLIICFVVTTPASPTAGLSINFILSRETSKSSLTFFVASGCLFRPNRKQ